VFETTHGSAPALAGTNKANPISAILAAAMMLEHLGEVIASETIRNAVETTCKDKRVWIDTDGCPVEGTQAVTEVVVQCVEGE
jgi:3-isopropylmalate dehydrogenase